MLWSTAAYKGGSTTSLVCTLLRSLPKFGTSRHYQEHCWCTRAHLISCMGGVTPHHRNHIHFKPSLTSVRPYGPLDHTGIQCLINWHGHTFDLLPRPHTHLEGFKGHTKSGTHPPMPGPGHAPVKPRPTASNKTFMHALMHTHTLHMVPGTHPQA